MGNTRGVVGTLSLSTIGPCMNTFDSGLCLRADTVSTTPTLTHNGVLGRVSPRSRGRGRGPSCRTPTRINLPSYSQFRRVHFQSPGERGTSVGHVFGPDSLPSTERVYRLLCRVDTSPNILLSLLPPRYQSPITSID